MSETIIVALIAGGVTLTVNILANWSARKKDAIAQAKRDQKLDDQIAIMNRKLDEHNRYGDKIGSMEKTIVCLNTKMEILIENNKERS